MSADPSEPEKRLLLFRHGKSDWDAPVGGDHERPLNKRGVRAAKTMGRVLADTERVPHHAITSSAVRARTTLELAHDAGSWPTTIEVEPALYHSSPSAVLEVVARTSPDVDSLMLVGHEPTWSTLASLLTGEEIPVKTATVVGIDLDVDRWNRAPMARGRTAFVLYPRDFDEAGR